MRNKEFPLPKPPIDRTSKYFGIYASVFFMAVIAVGMYEQRVGDGSFERLINSGGKLAVALAMTLALMIPLVIFGRMTASLYYRDCPAAASSARNVWMTLSLVLGFALGACIAMVD